MGLSGPLGAKLDEIIVALNKRNEARELQELAAPPEHFRIVTNALHQCINPLFRCERTPGLSVGVKIKIGHLDGFERTDCPRRHALIVPVFVLDVSNAPNAIHKEFWMGFYRLSNVTPLQRRQKDA